ncbi:MAG: hypothetical protein JF625_19670 [Inquilinus limosus]|uniref:Uncharacterized protein n=1 Tax=Inquilinus limosus TaxID=171674 RepID=A0A952FMB1_9PROT|nr:hypothetical protein [Inquilinus limosus]
MRGLGLALAPAWLLLAAHAVAAETDIRGWEGLSWGMTARQVESALPQAVTLSPPWDFGPLYAERMVQNVVVGGIAFDLVPELARKDDRLVQILFERRPPIPGPDELQSFVNDLHARLGPPAESCVVEAGLVTRLWRFPSAQVALTAVDFSADGSRGRLQRLLLRYTAADRAPPSPCERNKPRP